MSPLLHLYTMEVGEGQTQTNTSEFAGDIMQVTNCEEEQQLRINQ